MTSFWMDYPERADACKKLWLEGASATEIASEIGCSRNAVISKVHRSGWTRAITASSASARIRPQTRPKPKRLKRFMTKTHPAHPLGTRRDVPQPEPSEAARTSFAEGGAKPLASLLSGECHWPLGHPGSPDFGFCAAPKAAWDGSYCESHFRIAHTAPPARKRGGFTWAGPRPTR